MIDTRSGSLLIRDCLYCLAGGFRLQECMCGLSMMSGDGDCRRPVTVDFVTFSRPLLVRIIHEKCKFGKILKYRV